MTQIFVELKVFLKKILGRETRKKRCCSSSRKNWWFRLGQACANGDGEIETYLEGFTELVVWQYIIEKGKGVAQDESQVLAWTYIQYMLVLSAETGEPGTSFRKRKMEV